MTDDDFDPSDFKPPGIEPAWLRAALKHRRVSQAALARELGVSLAAVATWLSGRRTLRRSQWLAILSVLQLPPDWRPPEESPH